eukprot:CAMPEP_0184865940 /NCGR_PEP_ID=MMETSP0580-20130426/19860_1 /TAXON_ID=1118495 /ORGANISM="Dactyliosolen fragilissimus" /LENGTH=445 /DNA_ID=CAMNT_0027365343 /DNA_START=313 /DNA_END=1650 /DNA_ORIENTATION=-
MQQSSSNSPPPASNEQKKDSTRIHRIPRSPFQHTLAILTLPLTSTDRIANEVILETSMKHTCVKNGRLSVVLRCRDDVRPKLNHLRGYVGEIYSMCWDTALGLATTMTVKNGKENGDDENYTLEDEVSLLDVIVYPQHLPNAAPEQWIHHRPDLDCICSHDSITGWISSSGSGTGLKFSEVEGSGLGGLDAHVEAVNLDRKERGLQDVVGLEPENWPVVLDQNDANVVFLEDDIVTDDDKNNNILKPSSPLSSSTTTTTDNSGLIGTSTYRIPSSHLYYSVAVGGTFDGMHYGHRKLLTLAISSVVPNGGKLLIGVTTDEMLQSKTFSEYIPPLNERIKGVKKFLHALAPGIKNNIRIVPILDAYGPPGASLDPSLNPYNGSSPTEFDALVLSHETLYTGQKLNYHRVETLGIHPLKLLCTRRTEAHGMSSTTLRRLKKQAQKKI